MNIQPLTTNFIMPLRATDLSGGYDLFMPEDGMTVPDQVKPIGLGFAAAIPPGYVALLLPRSGVGAKYGVELNNTCGVIDADYRGEWKAALTTKNGEPFAWKAGDRLLQFILVPVLTPALTLVASLDDTERGVGGFGHSGQ